MGTAAFRSLNRKSISITTFNFSSAGDSTVSSGTESAGLASSLCPGMRWSSGLGSGESEVVMASAISPKMVLKGNLLCGSRGNLMSRTASTFPEVIHDIGPSIVVEFCR